MTSADVTSAGIPPAGMPPASMPEEGEAPWREALATERGFLLEGDGVEWLRRAEPGSIDLVVTDPPYNIGKAAWDNLGSLEDYLAWSQVWLSAAYAALKPTGTLYLMGFPEIVAQILAREGGNWAGVRWLTWYYRNKANLRDDWGRSHEAVLCLRKGKRFTFNTDPVRVPYNRHTTRYPERTQAKTSQYGGERKERWKPHPLGARPRDVLEAPVLSNGTREKTAHPTQKPVQLIRKLVLASSDPGERVVDPFGGSGTTALVAELNERHWVTIERDPTYVELARARILDPEAHAGAQTRESESATSARRAKLR
ncbi:MAG: site-specific DNA-methyltransferase [Planctomycetes bacterium]|nr:site-specific DNA-methyltransferase [Planctomycetota bacterium]